MVARKRHRDGIPALPLNLGIRRNINTKKAKGNIQQQQSNRSNDAVSLENVSNRDISGECDDQNGSLDDQSPNKGEDIKCHSTVEDEVNPNPVELPSKCERHSATSTVMPIAKDSNNSNDLENCSQQGYDSLKKNSLALLSCDYESSNSSSDNE